MLLDLVIQKNCRQRFDFLGDQAARRARGARHQMRAHATQVRAFDGLTPARTWATNNNGTRAGSLKQNNTRGCTSMKRTITTLALGLTFSFAGGLALAQDSQPASQPASQPTSQPAKPKETPKPKEANKPKDAPKPKETPKPAEEESADREDRTPAGLYGTFCSGCHDPGIAGAPKTGDKAAWENLLKTRDFEGMVTNTYKGIGLMPTRGACAECSEDEIRAVVRFMLEKAGVDPGKK